MIKGINYYHESQGFLYRPYNAVKQDMKLIKSRFNTVKLYHNPFTPNTLEYIATVTEIAKNEGLFVIWNENNDDRTFTETNWLEYIDRVKDDCLVASRLHVDEFLVGNEISIHNDNSAGFNDTNLPIKIKNLVAACRQLVDMPLSVEEGWWKKDAWNAAGLGLMDRIFFTLYENASDFQSIATQLKSTFGDHAVIGEWSTQGTYAQSASNELDWANQLAARKEFLEELQMPNFLFCFRDTGLDDNNKGFGMFRFDAMKPHLAWSFMK
jgi:hypothetical protein